MIYHSLSNITGIQMKLNYWKKSKKIVESLDLPKEKNIHTHHMNLKHTMN
jgi:hypothetical protein